MNTILHRIEQNQRISFARFNDGEIGAILGDLSDTSRGKQHVTPQLVKRLSEALKYRDKDYFIGIPCPECYPNYYKFTKRELGDYENQILAVSISNSHYNTFKSELLELLKDKNVAIIAEKRFYLPLNNVHFYFAERENADNDVDKLINSMGEHDYYILTIGAASRYLAMKLHQKGENALDLGSIFDPEKGKNLLKAHNWPYKYKNAQKHCPICNY